MLMEATSQLVIKKDFGDISVQEIADEVDVEPATFSALLIQNALACRH